VDFNKISQSFKDKEGCQLDGYIIVNKVPGIGYIKLGNFHISSHAFGGILN